MTVDCAQFAELVHDLERTGTQGFALRVSALAHAEKCPSCSALLEEVTLLDFALDAVAMEDRALQAPQHVEAALLAEYRSRRTVQIRPRRNFALVAALGLAAAVALALGIGISHWRLSKDGAAVNGNGGTAAVLPASAAASVQTAKASTSDAVPSAGDTEYATNFVSLPYADDPGTLEGGTVVRVTLSRDALASFGMPVADVSATERIPADIALSVDGVPQAIRLVSDENVDHTN